MPKDDASETPAGPSSSGRHKSRASIGLAVGLAIAIGGIACGILAAVLVNVIKGGSGALIWATAGIGAAAGTGAAPLAESVIALARGGDEPELSAREKHQLRLLCPVAGLVLALIAGKVSGVY